MFAFCGGTEARGAVARLSLDRNDPDKSVASLTEVHRDCAFKDNLPEHLRSVYKIDVYLLDGGPRMK